MDQNFVYGILCVSVFILLAEELRLVLERRDFQESSKDIVDKWIRDAKAYSRLSRNGLHLLAIEL